MSALLLLDDGWTAASGWPKLRSSAQRRCAPTARLSAADGRAGVERLAWVRHAPVRGQAQVLPLMAVAEAAAPLLFVDATHPAFDAHPAQGRIRRGETAALPSHHGRANVTLGGALSWPSREVTTCEAAKITGRGMVACFARIEARDPLARTIALVADNAIRNRATNGARVAGQARLPGARRRPARRT